MKVSYTWTTERIGNEGHVIEWRGTEAVWKWRGRANLTPAIVESRRRLLAMKMERVGATYTHSEKYDRPS